MAKIGVDCDGVLANFVKAFIEEANRIWPGKVPKTYEHKTWDFPTEILNKAEANRVWDKIKATPDWWLTVDAFTENVGALAVFFWTQKNHDIYIVTSRTETAGHSVAWQTNKWLEACGIAPVANYLGVIVAPNSDDKAAIYEKLGIEFSIDDKAETVEQCQQLGQAAFVLDRPWNAEANLRNRVRNLKEFLDKVVKG